jgi:hypothetical protein
MDQKPAAPLPGKRILLVVFEPSSKTPAKIISSAAVRTARLREDGQPGTYKAMCWGQTA